MNFNKYSEYYDLFYKNKKYSKEVKNIKKLVKFSKKDKVLEIGCGTGKHTFELSKYCSQILAIDKSKRMIDVAKKKHLDLNITFRNNEMFKIDETMKFDKIIMLFHVFSYFSDQKYINKVINKLKLLIKPGGLIIFDFWNSDNIKKDSLRDTTKHIKFFNKIIKREGKIKKIKKNVYSIKYYFSIFNKDKKKTFLEKHIMRAFNREDIKKIFKNSFSLINFVNLLTLKKASNKDFSILAIIKKND